MTPEAVNPPAILGPWHVEDGALTKGNETPTGWFICHPKTQCDATAIAWVEDEAIARLIAAAPDYAAVAPDAADLLEQYADFIRHSVKADDLEAHPYLPEIDRVVVGLRAAIAKATGHPARTGGGE